MSSASPLAMRSIRRCSSHYWTRPKTEQSPTPMTRYAGTLLGFLYPEVITPSQVWRYALPRNNRSFVGRFLEFWVQAILEKSSDSHLDELFDSLCENPSVVHSPDRSHSDDFHLDDFHLEAIPAELLAHCLEANGDNSTTQQLYERLTTVSAIYTHPRAICNSDWLSKTQERSVIRIREWLIARPRVQKEIFLTWLRQRDPERVNQRCSLS